MDSTVFEITSPQSTPLRGLILFILPIGNGIFHHHRNSKLYRFFFVRHKSPFPLSPLTSLLSPITSHTHTCMKALFLILLMQFPSCISPCRTQARATEDLTRLQQGTSHATFSIDNAQYSPFLSGPTINVKPKTLLYLMQVPSFKLQGLDDCFQPFVFKDEPEDLTNLLYFP